MRNPRRGRAMNRVARRAAAAQKRRSAKNALADYALRQAAENFYDVIREIHACLVRVGLNGDDGAGRVAYHDRVGPYGFRSTRYGRRTRALMWCTQGERHAFIRVVKKFRREAALSQDVWGVREAFRIALKLANAHDKMAAARFGDGALSEKTLIHG